MVQDESYEIDGLGDELGLLPAVYRYGPGPRPAQSHGNWYSYPSLLGATQKKAGRRAIQARAKAIRARAKARAKPAAKPVAKPTTATRTVTARVSARAPARLERLIRGYRGVFLLGIGAAVAYLAYKAFKA